MRELATLLLCLSISAYPQALIEVADQRTDVVRYEHVTALGDSLWVFSGSANVEGGIAVDGHFLIARNISGGIVWNTPVPIDVGNWYDDPNALALLPDTAVLVAGYVDWCDVASDLSEVIKIRGDGSIEWSRTLLTESALISMLAVGSTSFHAAASTDRVFILSHEGDSLTSWPASTNPIRGLEWDGDSSLIMLAGERLYRLTTVGETVDSVAISGDALDLVVEFGMIAVLRPDSVIVMDSALTIVGATSLLGAPGTPRSFVKSDGMLYILTESGLITCDSAFNPATSVEFELFQGQALLAASVRGATIMTAGICELMGRSAGLARSHDLNGNAPEYEDNVEIITHVDSAWFHFVGAPGGVPICSERARVRAQLVNHGTSPVDKVAIAFRPTIWYGYCGTGGQTLLCSGLDLIPDDSIDVLMPILEIAYGPTYPGEVATSNVCLLAESPNDKVDRFPDDNYACQSVTYVNTGIGGPTDSDRLRPYPVPFNNFLRIPIPEGANGTVDVAILDMLGRVVHTTSIVSTATSAVSLSLPEIEPGNYTLVLLSGGRSWVTPVQRSTE